MAGHKAWAPGEEALAVDWNGYLADQVVAQFPNAAARTAGWASPPEGAVSYLADIDKCDYYDGGAWRPVGVRRIGYVANNAGQSAIGTTYIAATGLSIAGLAIVTGRRYRFSWSFVWSKGAPDTATTCESRLALGAVGFIIARGMWVPAPGIMHTYVVQEWSATATGTYTAALQVITSAGFANIQSQAGTGSVSDAAWLAVDELGA